MQAPPHPAPRATFPHRGKAMLFFLLSRKNSAALCLFSSCYIMSQIRKSRAARRPNAFPRWGIAPAGAQGELAVRPRESPLGDFGLGPQACFAVQPGGNARLLARRCPTARSAALGPEIGASKGRMRGRAQSFPLIARRGPGEGGNRTFRQAIKKQKDTLQIRVSQPPRFYTVSMLRHLPLFQRRKNSAARRFSSMAKAAHMPTRPKPHRTPST